MKAILPGATIGFLGGGQLGRMAAFAALSMGYRVRALDPDPNCSLRALAEQCTTAAWDDESAFAELARHCDVVTYEIEKIPAASLKQVERFAPLRPGPHVLQIVQDRLRQKQWLSRQGIPVAAFQGIQTAEESIAASLRFSAGCFLKVTQGGYDGGSQIRLEDASQLPHAWHDLGQLPCICEATVPFESEISVLVAREPGAECIAYEPALNSHSGGILDWSVLPADLSRHLPVQVARHAQEMARTIAERIDLHGLLVVEMFILPSGELLVNELAPRTHNSYHASERACVTGQFEQLIRAICCLPLGSARIVRPGAIANLLGDLWHDSELPNIAAALLVPEVRLHLYGKTEARPGRKMGHFSATGETSKEALDRALSAREAVAGHRNLR